MSEDFTPRQQILLWDLVSRGGSAMQKDLKPDVKPADREPLVRAKMISVAKRDRALRLTLEDAGWSRLSDIAPTLLKSGDGSKYDRPILQFVLARVQAYAAANTLPYADIFAARADEAGTNEADGTVAPEPSLMPIETVIRATFFDIAGRPARNQVRLRQLRERLPNIPRASLDEALIRMQEARRARFSTLSNPPDIAEEGDAALRIRDQQFHTIWIEP